MNVIKKDDPSSTEEKIRQAAKKVFLQKGYAGTRTRDIAEEAGINLALLNYYFRSKQKLFEVVMLEKIQKLLFSLLPAINDSSTTIEEKIDLVVNNYIDVLTENPDLPIFVLSEIQKGNFETFPALPIVKQVTKSVLFHQLAEKRPDLNPAHFIVSLLGMTIFPFVARPIIMITGMFDEQSYMALMQERRKLVSNWMKNILNEKNNSI
jgi:AcrR family transcriptional regulator